MNLELGTEEIIQSLLPTGAQSGSLVCN